MLQFIEFIIPKTFVVDSKMNIICHFLEQLWASIYFFQRGVLQPSVIFAFFRSYGYTGSLYSQMTPVHKRSHTLCLFHFHCKLGLMAEPGVFCLCTAEPWLNVGYSLLLPRVPRDHCQPSQKYICKGSAERNTSGPLLVPANYFVPSSPRHRTKPGG